MKAQYRKAINFILEEFNFECVHKLMIFDDVKWRVGDTEEYRTPTIEEFKEFAKDILEQICEKAELVDDFEFGGLYAERFEDTLELSYRPVTSEAWLGFDR